MFKIPTYLALLAFSGYAYSSVITFEEVSVPSNSTVTYGQIGNIKSDTGVQVLDTSGSFDKPYLSNSPFNVAIIPKQAILSFSLVSGDAFDFTGSTISASNADGSFIQVKGWLNNVDIFTSNIGDSTAFVGSLGGTPRFFDFNWSGVDKITYTWTGSGTLCCSAGTVVLDDFTYTVVPVPAALWLFVTGLICIVTIYKSDYKIT